MTYACRSRDTICALDLESVELILIMSSTARRKSIATNVVDNASVSSTLNFTTDTYGYSHARVALVVLARVS